LATTAKITLRPLPPFDFRLSAMIFLEGDQHIRKYEGGRFWNVIRVDGTLLLTSLTAAGTVDDPKLLVELESNEIISRKEISNARVIIRALFNLDFDLEPFYKEAEKDDVMVFLTQKLRGLKSPTTPTIHEALIDSIVEQQISLKVANMLEERLIKGFGERLTLDKGVYYAFPTPQQLASASTHGIRECGLSQKKAEYIIDISRMIDDGKLDLEELKDHADSADIIKELDEIRGIGVWTAELTMIRGMQRLDAIPADDLGLRAVISHYYCNDHKISSNEARKIAENWGTWKGLASFYLIIASAMRIEIDLETRCTRLTGKTM